MAVRGVVFDVSEGKGKTKISSTCNNCTYKLIIRTLRFSVRFTFKIENFRFKRSDDAESFSSVNDAMESLD